MSGHDDEAPLHVRLRGAAARLGHERIALSKIADVHGPAAQGTLLVMLAAPCVLPVPGVGSVLGCGLAMMAWTMWRGQTTNELPERVAAFEMSATWARRGLGLLANFYALAGRLARSRWTHWVRLPPRSWLAAQAGLMAVLIILPIPFGNVLPALALMLLGLALVFRDGVAALLSAVFAAASVLYTAALGVAAWVWGLAPLMGWLRI